MSTGDLQSTFGKISEASRGGSFGGGGVGCASRSVPPHGQPLVIPPWMRPSVSTGDLRTAAADADALASVAAPPPPPTSAAAEPPTPTTTLLSRTARMCMHDDDDVLNDDVRANPRPAARDRAERTVVATRRRSRESVCDAHAISRTPNTRR